MRPSSDHHSISSEEPPAYPVGRDKSSRPTWVRVLTPVLIIVGGILFMKLMGSLKPEPAEVEPVDTRRAVEVMAVFPTDTRLQIQSQGVVLPKHLTSLVGEVSGKITRISEAFNAGGYFEQGDILLEIDPSDYTVAVRKAEATLAGRRASLAEETARAEQAQKDWDKLERQGTPSPLVLRQPQLAEAQANVSAAEADLARARRDLERTSIVAPYQGLVRIRDVDLGQYVTPGTMLGSIFAVDTASVRLPITDEQYALVDWPKPGLSDQVYPRVQLQASINDRLQTWMGRIVRTEAMLDEMTRLNYVVAEIDNPYNLLGPSHAVDLKMGTFVEASIEGLAVDEVFILPRETLMTDGRVMVMDPEDRLAFRTVGILRSLDDQVFIHSGLEAGDRVITTAIDLPVAGMALRIDQAPDPVPASDASKPLISDDQGTPQPEPDDERG